MESMLPVIASVLSAIIVGIIAFYFFKSHTDNEEKRRKFLLQKSAQDKVLPLRFQAYERIALFLERMDPNSLLIRVKPRTNDLETYENEIINNIEKEYEHNISQQVYLTAASWNVIKTTKNATIQTIRQTAMSEKVDTADKLRETLLNHFMGNVTPSQKALAYLKNEIAEMY